MNNYIVWIDSNNARIFALKTSGIEKSLVIKSNKNHHRRHKNDMRENSDSNTDHYFQSLASRLNDADQLLLIGPGFTKNHFKNYLRRHRDHTTLATKIIGLENLESFEHTSEDQMLSKARKFFKTYDLFHNPI